MIILVDQDGVLANFEKRLRALWREKYPNEFFIPISKWKYSDLFEGLLKERWEKIKNLYSSYGFFLSLEPIPGAIDALKIMVSLGHDVRVCTRPIDHYKHCIIEKYLWIEEHLGWKFTERMILTRDKTIVFGDFLIDDNPEAAVGLIKPSWEHIIFSQPYNRNVTGKRRLTWKNWRDILEI